jgi:hypothetical protein
MSGVIRQISYVCRAMEFVLARLHKLIRKPRWSLISPGLADIKRFHTSACCSLVNLGHNLHLATRSRLLLLAIETAEALGGAGKSGLGETKASEVAEDDGNSAGKSRVGWDAASGPADGGGMGA